MEDSDIRTTDPYEKKKWRMPERVNAYINMKTFFSHFKSFFIAIDYLKEK